MSARQTRLALLLWTAIVMAAVEYYIHAVLAPSHLTEQPYIGLGFVIADILLALVVIGLLIPRLRLFAWLLGATVCLGMFVALCSVARQGYRLSGNLDQRRRTGSGVIAARISVHRLRYRKRCSPPRAAAATAYLRCARRQTSARRPRTQHCRAVAEITDICSGRPAGQFRTVDADGRRHATDALTNAGALRAVAAQCPDVHCLPVAPGRWVISAAPCW